MAVLGDPGRAPPPKPDATVPRAGDVIAVDEDLIPLIPGFLESRRALVQQLSAAAGRGQRDAVQQLAHKLAGSLAMYGFEEAADVARGIEKQAHVQDAAALAARARELANLLDRAKVEPKVSVPG
jgi:two-component system response regulator BaeR